MTRAGSITSSEPLVSKRRMAWAGLAAIIGCAACCSLPILAAIVLGGGAAATGIASLVTPGAELIVAGSTFFIALGVMVLRARSRKARQTLTTDEIRKACDPMVFSKLERAAHYELAKSVILEWPKSRQPLPDGYLFHYEGSEELFLTLARWASSEHRCCPWAAFSLEMEPFTNENPGGIRLRMTGGAEGRALLEQGFKLLEEDSGANAFLNSDRKLTLQSLPKDTTCGCAPRAAGGAS